MEGDRIRPRRKGVVQDYARLHNEGFTELRGETMAEEMAADTGLPDNLLQDDFEEIPENTETWEERRKAVSDVNWKRQQEEFQSEMARLNERELVLEREKELLEMKEKMYARQQKIKNMEKDIAVRHAAMSRYDEVVEVSADAPRGQDNKVRHWLVNQTMGRGAAERDTRQNVHANQTIHDPYTSAMRLADDTNLVQCRQTGVSRLNMMGLAPAQRKLQRAGRSEPVLGEKLEVPKHKGINIDQPPVIGRQEDGESVLSFHSGGSLDASENRKKVKSGMYDKIADDVVMKLKWPHKKLDPRWVARRPAVHQLQFEHVVAGEIAIIMRSSNPEEVKCRLHILQKLAYWNLQEQGWPRVRDIYTGILHRLEEGEATWSATFDEYDMAFPIKISHNRGSTTGKREVFWCKDFNKGTCTLDSGHKATIAGRERVVTHICAACWKQGKREKHSETDASCPAKEL